MARRILDKVMTFVRFIRDSNAGFAEKGLYFFTSTVTPPQEADRGRGRRLHLALLIFPFIIVSPVTLKWSSGWSCSFLSGGRGCGEESFLNRVCLHTLQPLSTKTHRHCYPAKSARLSVCLSASQSVRTPWRCEAKPLGRITQVRRSRKPSLQRGCKREAFMWLPSLGLQRPTQFGVASLNFITMRFYSVVVQVYV